MRKPMEFSLEELVLQTGIAGGIGAAIGGPPGAVAGAISGFTGYVVGYFAGKSSQGLFDLDEKEAEIVRRFVEVAMPTKAVGSMTMLGRDILKAIAKAPKPIATGIKYGTFGLATGYVAEPYVVKDGDANAVELVGIAGLSALGLRTAQALAPLGIWAGYSARQVASVLSEGKYGAGVWVEEGMKVKGFEKVFGKELVLPKVKVKKDGFFPTFEVSARDVYWEGLFKSREEVAELLQNLKEVDEVFQKYGIKVGTETSRKIGEAVFNPVEQTELTELLKKTLKEEGLLDPDIEEISSAIKSLQKVSIRLADRLAELGGAGRHYLDMLGSDRRVFQHIFFPQQAEKKAEVEIRRTIRGEREAKVVLPSASTLRKRGLTRKATSQKMINALMEQLGTKKPKIGDKITVDGRIWTYTRLKEGGKPVWWSEYGLEEIKSRGGFADLSASLYRQISEDLGLVRQLSFIDYIHKLGVETGRVSSRPIPGYIRLAETGQSAVIKGWGSLTGSYVSPDLYRTLRAYVEMQRYNPPNRTLARINFRWKSAFLSLNFKSYVNAILGNMVLTFANGHDPAELIYHYTKGLRVKDKLYEEAKRHGLLKASLRWERVMASEAEELEKLLRPSSEKSPFKSMLEKPLRAFSKFTDYTAENWYGKVDEVFRYGLYRKLRESGVGEIEASRIALQTYAYYGDLPVFVRNLRDTIMPFVSYQVRIFPQIFKSFLKYPERYALTLAFIEGVQRQAFKEMYGENWQEGRKYEDLVRPAYMEERIGGFLADFIRVPTMEFEGGEILPSGYMYTGFIPWNIPISLPHLGITPSGDINLPSYLATVLIQNPVIRFVSGLFLHTDPSTGREVYSMAGVDRPYASILQYAMQTILPSTSLLKYPAQLFAREGWFDPVISWFNYFGTYPNGEPVGTAHMLWNAVAPSVLKFDPDFNLEMSLKRLQALERGYFRDYRRAIRRSAPEPVLENNWERLQGAIDEAWKKRVEILEQYIRAKGGR